MKHAKLAALSIAALAFGLTNAAFADAVQATAEVQKEAVVKTEIKEEAKAVAAEDAKHVATAEVKKDAKGHNHQHDGKHQH